MNIAVVGHVEWIEFVRVDHVPKTGEIVHAGETWCEAAGGGAVAAVQLARLAGSSTLFTAIGDDELGEKVVPELERHGVTVHAAVRPEPQRRGFTYVDSAGERTITVIGERLGPRRSDDLPWDELAEADGVYFVSGDAASLKAAREAKVLVATARSMATLAEGRVELDALVRSRNDEGETYRPGDLEPPPRTDVATAGSQGGTFTFAGGAPTPLPAGGRARARCRTPTERATALPPASRTGSREGLSMDEAVALAARSGAAALSRRGAHGA